MDASVLNVALTLSGKLLAQVGAVLVLDVLDDWVPAAVVVDEIAISGSIDNVQAQAHAILLDDVCDGVDFGGAADGLRWGQTTLAVDEVRCEDGVDEGRLSEARLSCRCGIRVSRCCSPLLNANANGKFARIAAMRGDSNHLHINVPTQMTLN